MPTSTRRVLISLAVLTLVGCFCLSILTIGGAGVGLYQYLRGPEPAPTRRQITPADQNPIVPSGSDPTQSSPSGDPVEATPTPQGSLLPEGVAEQMDEIQDQVLEIRGLSPSRDVPQFLLGPDELRQKVMDDFFDDYTEEDAADDGIVLHAFGLIPAEFDLLSMYVDLYSEIIAGFYDQEEDVMYIVQGDSFQGMERLTYSHEYTHVLQDQVYDIEKGLGYTDEACEEDSERCAAVQALIEGDASLVEQIWLFEHSTAQDKLELQQSIQDTSSPVFDAAPPFLQQSLTFPYLKGAEFVQTLYDLGGWQAVDDAYLNPPVSSEQILHPDQYPEDTPVPVSLPDALSALGSGWRLVDDDTLGEWYTFLTLAYGYDGALRLDENDARKAAAGWEGDRYAVYTRDSDQATVLLLVTEWDGADQAGEFTSAFARYGEERWGRPSERTRDRITWETAGEISTLIQEDARTVWLLAPDAQTAGALEALALAP